MTSTMKICYFLGFYKLPLVIKTKGYFVAKKQLKQVDSMLLDYHKKALDLEHHQQTLCA